MILKNASQKSTLGEEKKKKAFRLSESKKPTAAPEVYLNLGPGSWLISEGKGLLLELEIRAAHRLLRSCNVCLVKPRVPASAVAQHMEVFCV